MSKHTLHRDYETYSPVDPKKFGAHVYMENPETGVWCCAYAVDDGPIKLWTPGDPVPEEFIECAASDDWLAMAHNNSFERLVEKHIMAPRYGWPEIPLRRQRCTMVMAAALSLPQSLDNMLAALGTDVKKDMLGHRTMMTMARPRKPRKGEPPGLYWYSDDERKQRLYAYNKADIEAERAGDQRLIRLRPSEQELYFLDQEINDRGIYVDEKLCLRAKALVAHVTAKLDREMAIVTDWDVSACTNVSQLKAWVKSRGVDTEALDKEALAEILARHDLDPKVRRAIEIRQEAGKASVAKIDALLSSRCQDGRAKGLLAFHAAGTGRWAGRRFQPQNLPGATLEQHDIEDAISIIMKYPPAKAAAALEILHGAPLSVISQAVRGMVTAAPGKKLMVADFTSIEGVVLPWLAGEQWKLDAFREYIAGQAPDLYIQCYCKAFNIPFFPKSDKRRKVGKVMDLASGFQGGHGAYIKMGATGATLEILVEAVKSAVGADEWADAERRFDKRMGLTVDEWTALRIVIDRWRGRHPAIKQYWRDLEDAAYRAVLTPGELVVHRSIKFKVVGSFLFAQLPSGRALAYPYPKIEWKEMPWLDEDERPVRKQVVSFKGVDSFTKKWTTQYAYGGKWAENVTQAVARDLLAEAIKRLEAAGYPVVLHVHDEIVCEVDKDFGSLEEFENLMTTLPTWATGLPVAAEAWSGARYRK